MGSSMVYLILILQCNLLPMGHSIVVFLEGGFIQVKVHGCSHFGTCPIGLYREVVLIKGGLIRQVSLDMHNIPDW